MRYVTKVGIREEQEVEKLRKVCEDIAKRDNTFAFEIKPTVIKKFTAMLYIYSDTENMAHVRGLWFVKKMRDAKISDYYWVRIKE